MFEQAKASVITVGTGRGFVIERGNYRLVVTAAHCLPRHDDGLLTIPPVAISHAHERTFGPLLAPLGAKPSVWTECIFVDPVSDIAVLARPDDGLGDKAEAYDDLVESVTPIEIADARKGGLAWLLSLSGEWFSCTIDYNADVEPLHIDLPRAISLGAREKKIEGGMSGSPIVTTKGAVGVVYTDRFPNPRLTHHLPGWLLRSKAEMRRLRKERDEARTRLVGRGRR